MINVAHDRRVDGASVVRLSARAYAKRIGVSGSYVSRLVREGKLPADGKGRIDPHEADRALNARRELARPVRHKLPITAQASSAVGGGDLPTLLLKARTKTEVEKGRLLEHKAKVEAGKFVDADEVRVAAFNKARIVRDALLNIAARLSPLLAAESNERTCFELIDHEIRQALEELAN
jgi:hypothetical protein